MPETDCGIIILAAGSSSRLGKPKQLLLFKSKTLLQLAIDAAIASAIGEVVVVTGANHDNILSSLVSKTRFVYNENWQKGMASSMQTGLSALLSMQPTLSSVLIMLCDQPHVSSQLIKDMMAKKEETGKGIIACTYNEAIGVPALFSRYYFDALLSLQGSEGAKKIIMASTDDVAAVSFLLGAVDIDTREDYERLLK